MNVAKSILKVLFSSSQLTLQKKFKLNYQNAFWNAEHETNCCFIPRKILQNIYCPEVTFVALATLVLYNDQEAQNFVIIIICGTVIIFGHGQSN